MVAGLEVAEGGEGDAAVLVRTSCGGSRRGLVVVVLEVHAEVIFVGCFFSGVSPLVFRIVVGVLAIGEFAEWYALRDFSSLDVNDIDAADEFRRGVC